MDNDKSSKKPKRRLRAAPQTVRERAEQAAQKEETKAKRSSYSRLVRKQKEDKKDKSEKPKRKVFAPFRAIWRPLRWLGRHIIPGYFKGAFRELRLTTWPTRKQSRQLTTAVVLFAIIFGAFVATLDYGLNHLFKEILVK